MKLYICVVCNISTHKNRTEFSSKFLLPIILQVDEKKIVNYNLITSFHFYHTGIGIQRTSFSLYSVCDGREWTSVL